MTVIIKHKIPNKASLKGKKITIKKKPPTTQTTTPKPRGWSARELQSMQTTAEKFFAKTDTELAVFIEPDPEKRDAHNYRLNEEQREARLVLLHRLLIRKVHPAVIQQQLGVSGAMYYKLKDQLADKMRLDISKVDVPYLIGDTLAFYDEVRASALTISSAQGTGNRIKLSAMQVALRAEQDKNAFLASCGVYSEPIVAQIVRGMVSTANFDSIEGQSERVVEAEGCLLELAQGLMSFAQGGVPAVTSRGSDADK